MDVRVKFLGGAQTVTGSKYLLEFDDNFKVLVDCGLFQGQKSIRQRNWADLPFSPKDISAVVLTHAHLDHSGYLPKLVKEGFCGTIYCTYPTAFLLEILLNDSAKLMEEEAEFANKKGFSSHVPSMPLYTLKDAEKVYPLIKKFDYKSPFNIHKDVAVEFFNAGHILGSAITVFTLNSKQGFKKITFSGDLGRTYDPILDPPEELHQTDILFVESTYGNKSVSPDFEEELANTINLTYERKGVILIPAFAVGRTQTMLYYLKKLRDEGQIPNIPIFVDSPMAINVTMLLKKCLKYTDIDANEFRQYFENENVHYVTEQDASKALNTMNYPAIIISASGMCTGGRILHHLYHRLRNENDTILFVGYQAEETRGRKILDKEPSVKIFGEEVPINCHVLKINGLSAHADKDELLDWLHHFRKKPKYTFIVHGESKSSQALKDDIMEYFKWNNVVVPNYMESFQLFEGI